MKQAKQRLDELLAADPNCVLAYKELARFHIMDGHISSLQFEPGSLESAESALNAALSVDPEYADAYVLFGHLYRLMDRHDDAVAALERADAIGTDNPWLQLNWADLLLDEGRPDEAVQRYQGIMDSKTKNKKAMGVAFEGLIRYYKGIGAYDNADLVYQQMISYEPDTAWSYGDYASFLLYTKGDYEKAIEYGRKALAIMNYGVGRQALAAALYRKWAEILIKDDDEISARQYLDEAISIYPNIKRIAMYAGSSPHTLLTRDALRRAGLLPDIIITP